MYQLEAKISLILPSEHRRTTKDTMEYVKRGRYRSILVFEIPCEYHVKEKYVILDGHNRFEATRRIGLKTIHITVLTKASDFKKKEARHYHVPKNTPIEKGSFEMNRDEYVDRAIELAKKDNKPKKLSDLESEVDKEIPEEKPNSQFIKKYIKSNGL